MHLVSSLSSWGAASASYSLSPATVDTGGGRSSSASYTLENSSNLGGQGRSVAYSLRSGLSAGLPDPFTTFSLIGTSVDEHSPVGTSVGLFYAPQRPAGSVSYSLAPGTGATGNDNFALNAGTLRTAIALNYEQEFSHSIRVRASDGDGSLLEKTFTISVVNKPEIPLSIPTSDSLGFQAGKFGFRVTGPEGTIVIVYRSGDLVNWTPVLTNSMQEGVFTFSDPQSPSGTLFYRLLSY